MRKKGLHKSPELFDFLNFGRGLSCFQDFDDGIRLLGREGHPVFLGLTGDAAMRKGKEVLLRFAFSLLGEL